MAGDSKTEKATPKRRRDERKKGNVLMSKDAVTVTTLIGSIAAFFLFSQSTLNQLRHVWNLCFSYIADGYVGMFPEVSRNLFQKVILAFLWAVLPFLLITSVLAVSATFYQTKMLFAPEKLRPKFSHINPLEGFKRLFSLRSVVEAVKGLLKISVLLVLMIYYYKSVLPDFTSFLDMDLSHACSILFDDILMLMVQIAVAFVALAFFDYLYQWWDYERQLRMSKQEIKEEYKQMEGDPQIKGKIKQIQRQRAQQRMMQQVPQADVVIRNPTHFAVALRYDSARDSAPVVLAKGMDELALRIVRVAEEHQVAVVENVPLARSLYASTELDREIPPEFYGAVAEVLVYVLKLDKNPH